MVIPAAEQMQRPVFGAASLFTRADIAARAVAHVVLAQAGLDRSPRSGESMPSLSFRANKRHVALGQKEIGREAGDPLPAGGRHLQTLDHLLDIGPTLFQ